MTPHGGARLILELPRLLVIHGKARDIGRHEIGRALHAAEGEGERPAKGEGERGFPDAGDIVEKGVTARKQAKEQIFDALPLADDDLLDFFLYVFDDFVHSL